MSFYIKKITIIIIIIANSIKKISSIKEDLCLIFTFLRHGARSPPLKNEKYDLLNEEWKIGSYKLTIIGQRQLFLLGNLFNKKYNNFINKNYSPSEIYIFSTDNDRTLMSANSFLMGLFSYENKFNFNEYNILNSFPPFDKNLSDIKDFSNKLGNDKINFNNIQIIPIHIIEERDRLNKFWNECPLIGNLLDENMKCKEINDNAIKFNQSFSEELNKILNFDYDKYYFLNHKNISHFCNVLYSDIYDGRKLDIFNKTKINLTKLYNSCFETFQIDNIFYWGKNKEMNLIYSTSLLKKLINSLKSRVEININKNNKNNNDDLYNENNPKMFVFSGHDYDLISLIVSLKYIFNLNNGIFYPKFSSSLTIELYYKNNDLNNKIKESDFIVKIYFNGELFMEIDYLKFYNEINNKMYNEEGIKKFCKKDNDNNKDDKKNDDNEKKNVEEYFNRRKNFQINYQGYFAIIFGILSLLEFIFLYRQIKKTKIRNYNNEYFNIK